ncbi:MAG: efflux RND transporter permease subunit [bacterium]|nr:efflux RND transporter permease subunit [bacterium]
MVVNDAIVFLDRANNNIKRGMGRKDAIIETGKARLHPILLTTITTILGLTSILSDDMWQALAVTIMFGIFFGSMMTLLVLPAIYYDRDKLVHLIKRVFLDPLLVNSIFF